MDVGITRKYVYQPLRDPELHIRLVVLRPAAHVTDAVVCDLEMVQLASSRQALHASDKVRGRPTYTALSYCWGMNSDGNASLNRQIILDGQPKAITQNLFEGLLRIRSANETPPSLQDKIAKRISPVRLWIDAICIDQANIPERNAQVSIMDRIYHRASRVIIWLGEGPSEREDRAVLAMLNCQPKDNVYRRWKDARSYGFRRRPHPPHQEHYWENAQGTRTSLCDLDLDLPNDKTLPDYDMRPSYWKRTGEAIAEMHEYLDRFAARRYFLRRWIIQEIYYGRREGSCEIYWGPVHCAHSLLVAGLERTSDLGLNYGVSDWSQAPLDEKQLQRVVKLLEFNWWTDEDEVRYWWNSQRLPSKLSLPQALVHFDLHECSDDRDRLFAVASLDPGLNFKADYSLSVSEAYIGFARALVEKGHCYTVLSNLGPALRQSLGITYEKGSYYHDQTEIETLSLPSWVPDLRGTFGLKTTKQEFSTCEGATMSSDNILICTLTCIAVIEEVRVDNEIAQIGFRRLPIQLPATKVRFFPTECLKGAFWYSTHRRDRLPRPADVICYLTRSGLLRDAISIVLRQDAESNIYTVVDTVELYEAHIAGFAEFIDDGGREGERRVFHIK